MNFKGIIIDFNDLKSIKKAEKEKAILENDSYTLHHTTQLEINKFEMIYIK